MKKTETSHKACSGTRRPFYAHPIGIRARLLAYLIAFVAFIILLLWLFQIVFLDSFYQQYKTRQVQRTGEILMQNLDLDTESIQSLTSHIADESSICVLLLDENMTPVISMESSHNCLLHHMTEESLQEWFEKVQTEGHAITHLFRMNTVISDPELVKVEEDALRSSNNRWKDTALQEHAEISPPPYMNDNASVPSPGTVPFSATGEGGHIRYRFGKNTLTLSDDSVTIKSLLYATPVTLPSGSTGILFLNTQINPVSATSSALREQLLVITMIVSVMAVLLAFLISRNLSRPLIQTNEAAKALSRSQYTPPRTRSSYREIDELNQTLENAARDLGQVENLQHELIANISHDLRTPLTMIGGYAEAMRDIPSENTPENMQIIIDETRRLSTLVNELLDFSRLQSGSQPLEMDVFSLTSSVRAMIERIGKLIENDGYTIVFDPKEEYLVKADENRIGRVIYNLIGNALTYTGADRMVRVTQTLDNGYVRLSIQDSGKGIAKDELDLIWNRYYRTKETHKRAIVGSGLGLHIVRSILEQHQVPFGVESEEGVGTTFWFALPLVTDPD
ncbi:MAG: HAMP domain-containing histidine kinase [Clostridia bacterium]|nr:HAMP domain-containing histidine kinase [Clostridia bacterium]